MGIAGCGLRILSFFVTLSVCAVLANAQEPREASQTIEQKKANARSPDAAPEPAEPFDGATVEKMAAQCVTLETELGAIERLLVVRELLF